MIHALRRATENRTQNDVGQIVRVDMVGKHIVRRRQRRCALAQTVHRQTVIRIDAGHAQDGKPRLRPLRPLPQHLLRIDAPQRARILWRDRPCLVEQRAAAIAVDAGRADINDGAASG